MNPGRVGFNDSGGGFSTRRVLFFLSFFFRPSTGLSDPLLIVELETTIPLLEAEMRPTSRTRDNPEARAQRPPMAAAPRLQDPSNQSSIDEDILG